MKGQLNSMEPVLVIVMLAMILGVGLLFWAKFSSSQDQIEASVISEKEAVALLQKISGLPELACPESETVETYCFDLGKIVALQGKMQNQGNRSYYFGLFGQSRIVVRYVDLQSGTVQPVEIYDALPYDTAGNVDTRGSSTFFTVYDPLWDYRYFAVIDIERAIQ